MTHAYTLTLSEHSALAQCLRQKLREHSCGQGSACSCVHDTSWLERLPLHCSHVTVTDSPLGQSVTLTQTLASSSRTVSTGHQWWCSPQSTQSMYLLMDIIVNLFGHMHQKARNWDIYIHMHEAINYLYYKFFWGEDGRRKYALGIGVWGNPLQESVSVPLSEHIYSSVFTGRQEFTLSHYFVLQLGKMWGGSLSVWGRSLPPTPFSRLNPDHQEETLGTKHGSIKKFLTHLTLTLLILSTILHVPATADSEHISSIQSS